MKHTILFVDDEQNVLDGIRRQLRKQFNIDTALGPEQGLERVRSGIHYSVVVSDMRMPGMDGIAFLNEVEQDSPDTVLMMLTGNSDQQTAIDAVNRGHIFRFMNKPCTTEILITNLEAALRQYELVTAEKELLEKTLKGSIEALVDILALTNPAAFSCAERIKYYVAQCAESIGLNNLWKFEVAAMLSQIGYVTIPTEIMEKSLAGESLTDEEQQMLEEQSADACQTLDKIPRLEDVSQMIALKDTISNQDPENEPTILGAQLLRAAIEYDKLISRGSRAYQALHQMREQAELYNPLILDALEDIRPPSLEKTVCFIEIKDLRIGMVLAEDIRNSNNMMVVSKGQSVSGLMQRRLENFLQQGAIDGKVRVYQERQVFMETIGAAS